jgi:hypothetical protein
MGEASKPHNHGIGASFVLCLAGDAALPHHRHAFFEQLRAGLSSSA